MVLSFLGTSTAVSTQHSRLLEFDSMHSDVSDGATSTVSKNQFR